MMDIQYNHEGQKGQIIEKKRKEKMVYICSKWASYIKKKRADWKKKHTHIYI